MVDLLVMEVGMTSTVSSPSEPSGEVFKGRLKASVIVIFFLIPSIFLTLICCILWTNYLKLFTPAAMTSYSACSSNSLTSSDISLTKSISHHFASLFPHVDDRGVHSSSLHLPPLQTRMITCRFTLTMS